MAPLVRMTFLDIIQIIAVSPHCVDIHYVTGQPVIRMTGGQEVEMY